MPTTRHYRTGNRVCATSPRCPWFAPAPSGADLIEPRVEFATGERNPGWHAPSQTRPSARRSITSPPRRGRIKTRIASRPLAHDQVHHLFLFLLGGVGGPQQCGPYRDPVPSLAREQIRSSRPRDRKGLNSGAKNRARWIALRSGACQISVRSNVRCHAPRDPIVSPIWPGLGPFHIRPPLPVVWGISFNAPLHLFRTDLQ